MLRSLAEAGVRCNWSSSPDRCDPTRVGEHIETLEEIDAVSDRRDRGGAAGTPALATNAIALNTDGAFIAELASLLVTRDRASPSMSRRRCA